MFKPEKRWLLMQPCKNPFPSDELDVFARDCERQKEIGWGCIIAAGPDATHTVGQVVFFNQGTELRYGAEHSKIRLALDEQHVMGVWDGPVEEVDRKADSPASGNIAVPDQNTLDAMQAAAIAGRRE